MTAWRIYYRGSLSSCNYACGYCPFAKRANTRDELAVDRSEVERFVAWVKRSAAQQMAILFTPWGEALGHRHYRQALTELSRLPQVRRVSIQTNLSAPLASLSDACRQTLTLWATYHPGQVSRQIFLSRCQQLQEMGLRFSVGVVGLPEHLREIEALRAQLPREIYLWVNSTKTRKPEYGLEELARLRAVDPLFALNNKLYSSRGEICRAGETHFTVDGKGDVRRCHFVSPVIANIYRDDLTSALRPRSCPADSCGCYIGYIHLPSLGMDRIYGEDLLGRIPRVWPDRAARSGP